jgi:hypothetical protein
MTYLENLQNSYPAQPLEPMVGRSAAARCAHSFELKLEKHPIGGVTLHASRTVTQAYGTV